MKRIVNLIITFFVILIVTSFIAPVIYNFTDYKFYRIVSRSIMVQVLLVAFLYFKFIESLNVKRFISSYGLGWEKGKSYKNLLNGFFCGFCVLTFFMLFEFFLGARFFELNIKSSFLLQIIEYIIAAFLIAFLEEIFFRGMIFGKLRTKSFFLAFIVTTSFYGLIHFLKPFAFKIDSTPSFWDTFRVCFDFLLPFSSPLSILPGFIGLFLFGALLIYAYIKTSSLYYSVGLHAGVVFFLKADTFYASINPDSSILIHGDKNIYNGLLGWCFILLMWFISFKILHTQQVMENSFSKIESV